MKANTIPLVSALLLQLACYAVRAQSGQYGDFAYAVNGDAVTIANYAGSGGAVTVPSSINGLPVTSIGQSAFDSCYSLTSVTIGNSVTSIEGWAFDRCTNLTSVTIPNGVTTIGKSAFSDCTNLTRATIPKSVTNLGEGAFALCVSLTDVFFMGNAPSGGEHAFYGDHKATVHYLPGTTGWGATFGDAPTSGPDKTRPTVAITYPVANGSVSNALLTVTGKAKDNVAVASVYYRLNTNDWAVTATTNHWTNWTANVTLAPGANTVQAYAVDTSQNPSLTNTVKFTFVLYAPLTVQLNGQGTASPNYNGKQLQIGKSYTLTAMPGRGIKFTGWTGSTNATTSRLTFQMASNLTFTANFADTQRPVLAILSPKTNQKVSTEALTVSGKASDNVGVVSVLYQLNGAGWNPATTANDWTNWTAEATLASGVNTIQAYAVDAAGNASLTNTVKCAYGAGGQGDLAPDSISGMSARVSPRGDSTFTVTFGAAAFSQSMLPGNSLDNNAVGVYSYTKLSPATAQLAIVNTAPPSMAASGSNIVALTFTKSNGATFVNTNDDGTVHNGTISFSQAANSAPGSLEGHTLHAMANKGQIAAAFGDGTLTETEPSGIVETASYTYDQYSPVGGMLITTFTSPAQDAGSVHYIVLTFSSASAGSYYLEHYDVSGTESGTGTGAFTLH